MSRRAKGEGSRTKVPDGTWKGYVTIDGRRVYRRAKTRRLLDEKLEAVRQASEEGPDRPRRGTGPHTVATWTDAFLAAQQVRLGVDLKHRSFEAYERCCRLYIKPHLGDILLADLSPEDLDRWHVKLLAQLGPSTVAQAHRTLATALQVAFVRGHVTRNVARLSKAPGVAHRERPPALKGDQVDRLVEAVNMPDSRLDFGPARLLMATMDGLRQGEVLGLQWPDIDMERAVIHVRRTLGKTQYLHGLDCPHE